ncbi:DUF4446 family protein [Candidatus Parcubacteria bacterium]|nr:DUF4446 family protein [Patescibacteria group bacterium]MCG2688198.1 DUF4446 family protein [Candidatus Parcubacteria bacterium]MCG2697639.1 DUF4446 family protein [Candidatus Parcubacteria bacterium]
MFDFLKRTKKEPENLQGVLKELKALKSNFSELSKDLKGLKIESRSHFKRIGFVRYNPFTGVGGDQSFSIALLDDHNNGVVLTSLFSREGNRVYAKIVEKGVSPHVLSDEEKQAIKQATEKND